jgi:AAA domain (dynein-related subfamily)
MSTTPVDPTRSCLNCPSLLPADDSHFFKKAIGAPVCARYGKPIGRATSSEFEKQNIARQFAATCPSYGEPKPLTPNWEEARFLVMLPDPKVLGVTPVSPDLVTSCAGCKNFVRDDIVAKDLGWTTSLCAAKGRLLLANRYTLEAKHCDVKDFGSVRTDTTGLTFLPEYEDNFMGAADPVRAMKKALENFIDPRDYVTDRPVDPKDEHRIRAWRKIVDPLTGNEVFLPIYRRDFFDEAQRRLIPTTGDEEHPEDYIDHGGYVFKTAVLWTELDETPALWGQAGTGKTEFFRHMAWLMQMPFLRFSITGSTEVDELIGTMRYTEGVGTHFNYGRFAKAWSTPCVMVVDEWNVGTPDVQQVLRPCIDNSKQLVIDANDGERLDRDLDCYLGVAMNPAWDVLNVGANMISDADANRLMHFFVELPPLEIEREIIRKRCSHDGWEIPDDMLQTVLSIATDIRALTNDGTLMITWGIRPQLKAARALRWFDWLTSYKMAAGDFLEPEQQQLLLDAVRTHTESGV